MIIEAHSLSIKPKDNALLPHMPIYWITSGDEFWFYETKFIINKWLNKLGYTKQESGNNLDLFADKTFQEIHIPSKSLSLLDNIPNITNSQQKILVILSANLTFTNIKQSKHKFIIENFNSICFIIPKNLSQQYYINWAHNYIRSYKLNLKPDAIQALINYTINNPLALKQACFRAQINYAHSNISLDITHIMDILDFSNKYTQFDWLNAIAHNNINNALNIILELKKQRYEPIQLLWCLAKELQSLLEIKYDITSSPAKKSNFYQKSLSFINLPLSIPQILDLINLMPDLDAASKGLSKLPIWVILQSITLFLTTKNKSTHLFSTLFGLNSEAICKI